MTWHYSPDALRCVPGKKLLRWGVVFPARKKMRTSAAKCVFFFAVKNGCREIPQKTIKEMNFIRSVFAKYLIYLVK